MLGELFMVFLCFFTGFYLGHVVEARKTREEISLLRRSLSYWRSRLGVSYKTFDPDLYDK